MQYKVIKNADKIVKSSPYVVNNPEKYNFKNVGSNDGKIV